MSRNCLITNCTEISKDNNLMKRQRRYYLNNYEQNTQINEIETLKTKLRFKKQQSFSELPNSSVNKFNNFIRLQKRGRSRQIRHAPKQEQEVCKKF